MKIRLLPVAKVKNSRKTLTDDYWEEVISEIGFCDHIPAEAFQHISCFSHSEITYSFDKLEEISIIFLDKP